MPQEYSVSLEVGTVVIGLSSSVFEMLNALLSRSLMSSPAVCNLTMTVQPALPFQSLHTPRDDHGLHSFAMAGDSLERLIRVSSY